MNLRRAKSPYAIKQPRALGRARKFAIIVSLAVFLLTAFVIKFGIAESYPHPTVLSIFVVGIGFLIGRISLSIDEKLSDWRLRGIPFLRSKVKWFSHESKN